MSTLDYTQLLERANLDRFAASGATLDQDLYDGGAGVQMRTTDGDAQMTFEAVRLSENAFLLASEYKLQKKVMQRQIVEGGDWVHFQFRIKGCGREVVSAGEVIETPDQSCVVTRYPDKASIDRELDETANWRVACVFVSPKGLIQLLDTTAAHLPDTASWLAADGVQSPHAAQTLPLQSAMAHAVNDILGCTLRGGLRRAYMRAKSVELLSTTIHGLSALPLAQVNSVRLSRPDFQKLERARTILAEQMEGALTLAQLARAVGLNRTKLSLGFKQVYGTSVHAYWRDLKLAHARELLKSQDARITDIAFSLGYSEISSFTRAFTRKYGVLPSDVRGRG